jgi:iduronate 2-sulfatase
MMQRVVYSVLVFFLVACSGKAQEKKNVLFIIADDLNCYLGSYGHQLAKTPNIDKLAEEGLLFENAYCNFPLCGPSRASMMTGLYPDQNNVKGNAILIRDRVPDAVTMTQVFMNHGYAATRIGKIYHYNNPGDIGTPGHDDPASWSHTINPRGRDKDEEDQIFSLVPGSFGAVLSWLAAEGTDEEQTDGIVATEAIAQLEKHAASGEPFFLGVGFYKPHTPYVAPKRYFELYPREQISVPEVPEGYLESLPEPAQRILTMRKPQIDLPDSLAVSAIQAYLATISFLDAQVGRVLDALEQNGLKDNTIVVFTSDHGYHMGEHGHYQKRTLFEYSARIPLIISYPGQSKKGQRTGSIVEMIDFYPTLCEMAGLEYPEHISGKSMVPVLNNPRKKIRKDALTQTVFDGYSVITDRYRYIRWGEGGEGMVELYDIRNDPGEMINLVGREKYEKVMKELDKQLNKRVEAAGKM